MLESVQFTCFFFSCEKLKKGAVTGQREDPLEVKDDMKTANDDDGETLFL